MNKEELIRFLKDNLKVSINTNKNYPCYGEGSSGISVSVKIEINDEVISESEDTFYLD